MAGEIRNKAISASNKVEVEVEAELGKTWILGVPKKTQKNLDFGYFLGSWIQFFFIKVGHPNT